MDSRGESACSILLTWKLFIFHLLKSPSSSDYVINLMCGWGGIFYERSVLADLGDGSLARIEEKMKGEIESKNGS